MSSVGSLGHETAVAIASAAPAPGGAFIAAMVLYAVAALIYFALLFGSRPWAATAARWVLVCAFLAHAIDIASRDLQGVSPGTSVREAVGALSWVLVGGYLASTLKYRLAVLGGFVAPLALILLGAARLTPGGEVTAGLSVLGRVHISLATLGIAIFALATALAVMYLLAERNLKRKQFGGVLFRKGVALETLDTLLHRLIAVGFPIFTIAMMLGAIWASQRGLDFDRAEYGISAVTWLAFAVLLLGRTTSGWRGRKAAWLTIAGFGAAVIVLAIYLVRGAVG